MVRENNRSKDSRPKYVKAYNEILQMILDGVYVKGDKLPTEPQLAESLGISRMTLRQALNLLNEDGIVENRRGVGNFIRKNLDNQVIGLEQIEIPVYKCCSRLIDDMKVSVKVDSSKDYKAYLEYLFKRPVSVVLGIDRFYFCEGNAVVYGFSSAPIDILALFETDLDNEEEVKELFEKKVYEIAHHVSFELKAMKKEDCPRKDEIHSDQDLFMVLSETLYNKQGEVLFFSKYYFPAENIDFKVNLYNR